MENSIMNIIKSGAEYRIYGEAIETYSALPLGTYNINYGEKKGFWLTRHDDLKVSEKIYGSHYRKVQKVINMFKSSKRNVGTLLSGDKGIGKSICSAQLAKACIEDLKIPVILVNAPYPGLIDFMESIKVDCMFLFDEYDKNFCGIGRNMDGDKYYNSEIQNHMLSFFDGIGSCGQKLFVITCNEIRRISNYLLNRPGRFHYHFRFDYPTIEEIKDYMFDNLIESDMKEDYVLKTIMFSQKVKLNYDCLRAVSQELNVNGGTFEDCINDINIVDTDLHYYKISLHFKDSDVVLSDTESVDLFTKEKNIENITLQDDEGNEVGRIRIDFSKSVFDIDKGMNIISGEYIKFDVFVLDNHEKERRPEKNMSIERIKNLQPDYVSIIPSQVNNYKYF